MAGKRNADGSVTLKVPGRIAINPGGGKAQNKAPLAKADPTPSRAEPVKKSPVPRKER